MIDVDGANPRDRSRQSMASAQIGIGQSPWFSLGLPWSPLGSAPPFDARGDAGANVVRLRIHGRQERVQVAPHLVKLVHQRQHN